MPTGTQISPPLAPAARSPRLAPLRFGAGAGLTAAVRGLVLAAITLAGVAPLAVIAAAASLVALGGGLLADSYGGTPDERILLAVLVIGAGGSLAWFGIPKSFLGLRRLAGLTRDLAGRWCGVPIADPYRPLPPDRDTLTFAEQFRCLARDPATGRDLLWITVNLLGAWALAAASAVVIATGLIVFIGPEFLKAIPPPAFPGNAAGTLIVLGLGITALAVAAAPLLLRGYGLLARSLLAPAGHAELARRVQRLTETRTDALDTGAAEIRRIERDLHDGAQARLVAMGMTLDAAGQIIGTNPEAARALLYEARDASVKALAELRDLVRGIHPPVLADRGLAAAVQAQALDSTARISLASDLEGRPPAPVESAAYFAVSELLANVSKHADARQTWIDIRHEDGMLRIGVTDNGHGGADPARGTGLRGIERRLAVFDGVLAVSSPPGGPTAVTMEIPCALSLPKTSSC
ncbi:MAG TPA: histidine kinase [Streptosporangiaceae bacterium]|jgi:signal transduction histidine kinase